ncbi:hypothetical protein AB1Y20_005612 [Prymnesium parvum]|uniref:Cytochrome b5 heme-binding domain-containing protein n=1 Tax=Prymnesium parvum TaxID=97485 RepID=A0AB34J4P3_PRYPA
MQPEAYCAACEHAFHGVLSAPHAAAPSPASSSKEPSQPAAASPPPRSYPGVVVTPAAQQTEGVTRNDYLGRPQRYFAAAEIARHNTPMDCWLVAHGKVYDVTSFLKLHPAGEFSIVRHAGKDASEDFDFHHKEAQKMWSPYFLGYVLKDETCVIS